MTNIKIKLLNDNDYCGFEGVKFPLVVKAEECGRGYLVEGSELIKLGICEPCKYDEFLYFNSDTFEVVYD